MPILKLSNPKKNSKRKVKSLLKYVLDEEKTSFSLTRFVNTPIAGYDDIAFCMDNTKKLYGKKGGRQYGHLIISFSKDDDVDINTVVDFTREFVEKEKFFDGFEAVIVGHTDSENPHAHIVLNSVNAFNGKKFSCKHNHYRYLFSAVEDFSIEKGLTKRRVKDKSKEKGDFTTFDQGYYQLLKNKRDESYKYRILQAIQLNMLFSTDSEEFEDNLKASNIGFSFNKNNEIVFTDFDREEAGEKLCKVKGETLKKEFNLPTSKEELFNELSKTPEERVWTALEDSFQRRESEESIRQMSGYNTEAQSFDSKTSGTAQRSSRGGFIPQREFERFIEQSENVGDILNRSRGGKKNTAEISRGSHRSLGSTERGIGEGRKTSKSGATSNPKKQSSSRFNNTYRRTPTVDWSVGYRDSSVESGKTKERDDFEPDF